MRLTGKVAIVTAAAGIGIGQATAHILAQEGASVVVSDRSPKRISEVVEGILSLGGKAVGVQCDVSNGEQVDEMAKHALEKWGRIDILVNNAGAEVFQPLLEMSEETWDLIINTNLKGLFYCVKAVLPTMITQRSGKIINISSIAAWSPPKVHDSVAYCAAKGGIVSFTRALAREVGKYNINVNCIAPGVIPNPILEKKWPPGWAESILDNICFQRLGEPNDIASVVVFLASDESSYMTGACLSVDGGMIMS